jgi:hypothetical protein
MSVTGVTGVHTSSLLGSWMAHYPLPSLRTLPPHTSLKTPSIPPPSPLRPGVWAVFTASFYKLPVRHMPPVFACPGTPALPSLGMLSCLHLIGSLWVDRASDNCIGMYTCALSMCALPCLSFCHYVLAP